MKWCVRLIILVLVWAIFTFVALMLLYHAARPAIANYAFDNVGKWYTSGVAR